MNKANLIKATDHAIQMYPRESCGLLVAVKRREVYIPCRNIAENPNDEFIIHPEDQTAAEEQGELLMLIHSHPDASPRPSPSDVRGCENSEIPWCILGIQGLGDHPRKAILTGVHIFEPTGFEIPYRGREFIFGQQDCYTLVQDFYKREKEVVLPDFEREDKFWERGEDLYMDNFAACGFDKIETPSQKGDLILMNIRSEIVNHAGIWLGEADHMLHHPYQHLSEKTVYGGYWAENTRLFIRKVR